MKDLIVAVLIIFFIILNTPRLYYQFERLSVEFSSEKTSFNSDEYKNKKYELSPDITLSNFKEKIYGGASYNEPKKDYPKLFLQYRNLLDKNLDKVTYETIEDYRVMFYGDPRAKSYAIDKNNLLDLFAFQLEQGIKNNPMDYRIYDLKKQWLFGHYSNCASNSYNEECKKFHEEMLELDKKVCQYGGRCDLDGLMDVDSYIKSHFNKKEDIETFYDSLEEFFMTLDTTDKRVVKGLIENLIYEYYFLASNMASSVDLHEYYLQRKQKIDNKFKKAVELDKKYKVLENTLGGEYYEKIITSYKKFEEPQMAKHYEDILNKTFDKKTDMIGPDGAKWKNITYTRKN